MTDTHINVFFRNVQEAEAALVTAKGNLSTAKAELEEKKKEVDWKEEPQKKVVEEPQKGETREDFNRSQVREDSVKSVDPSAPSKTAAEQLGAPANDADAPAKLPGQDDKSKQKSK